MLEIRIEHLFWCPTRSAGDMEEHDMALVQIPPVEVRVRWSSRTGAPAQVHWTGHHLRITRLDAIRDERAAYPAARGPRVTFVLGTDDGGRAELVFDGRRRRWFVEALEAAA
jgi:hypothetical protein